MSPKSRTQYSLVTINEFNYVDVYETSALLNSDLIKIFIMKFKIWKDKYLKILNICSTLATYKSLKNYIYNMIHISFLSNQFSKKKHDKFQLKYWTKHFYISHIFN